ncbi:D-amino acid dehydrogenase small subunit [Rhodococcus wratislaviensis]|uniref:D-amino acid dehydrogenase small subunit n=1 Tax=Rhodococcus wratislaviensis TaxID=44752 RepID=A0A402CNB2_RHOWR|nr:D-amino acid dehydrogenase small subunit [Rhodococcus wratislaviensis]
MAFLVAGECACQAAAGLLGDRGCEEEVEGSSIEAAENVVGQVFADRSIPSGQVLDQLAGVRVIAQCQRDQLQCRRPPVRRLFEFDDVGFVQGESGAVDEQLGRLVNVETQRRGVDFDEFVVHTHSAEWETEPGTAGDDQVQVMATVLEQEGQRRPRVLVRHAVPVVDDEGDVVVGGMEPVDQRGENIPLSAGAVDLDLPHQFPAEGWLRDRNGLDQVGEEPDERVVVVVDRQPRSGHPLPSECLDALGGECALAEPRGCVNEHETGAATAAQAFEQVGARHRRTGRNRRTVLGGCTGWRRRLGPGAAGGSVSQVFRHPGPDLGRGPEGAVVVTRQGQRQVGQRKSDLFPRPAEHRAQFAGGGRAICGVTGHRRLDRDADGVGDALAPEIGHWLRADAQKLCEDLFAPATGVGGAARERGEQCGTESVDVGDGRRAGAAEQFRRGIGRGPGHQPVPGGLVTSGDAGDTEVGQLWFAVLGQQNVGRFDIAMQYSPAVRGFEGAGEFDPDGEYLGRSQRPVLGDPRVEGVPAMERHHDVGASGVGDPGLQDVDDVRVPGQPAHGLLLAQETCAIHVVRVGAEDLDCHQPVERRLPASVDDAEAAAPGDARLFEAFGRQLRDDVRVDLALSALGVVRHGWPSARRGRFVDAPRPG